MHQLVHERSRSAWPAQVLANDPIEWNAFRPVRQRYGHGELHGLKLHCLGEIPGDTGPSNTRESIHARLFVLAARRKGPEKQLGSKSGRVWKKIRPPLASSRCPASGATTPCQDGSLAFIDRELLESPTHCM
eukprot:scaffold360_cov374-Pavlova_lutheri.AAC.60